MRIFKKNPMILVSPSNYDNIFPFSCAQCLMFHAILMNRKRIMLKLSRYYFLRCGCAKRAFSLGATIFLNGLLDKCMGPQENYYFE